METKKEKSIYKKAGQTQGAIGAVISLIVGVGVAVLVLIFVGVLGGSAYEISESDLDTIGNNLVTADSFTANNNTAVSLDHGFIQEGTISIYNNTAPHTEFGLGNFTIDYDAGTILLLKGNGLGAAPFNDTTLNANYTWGADDVRHSVKAAVLGGFQALEDTGNYLPLIVLGIVIFLILGLVLGMTALSGKNSGGSAL